MLEASMARRWVLAELAEELHLAPGYLVRLFKAATGLPPMAYLAQVRAEYAAVMLLHSDEPVTCIGRAVGWPDQELLRPPLQGPLRAQRHDIPQALRHSGGASTRPRRRVVAVGRGAVPAERLSRSCRPALPSGEHRVKDAGPT